MRDAVRDKCAELAAELERAAPVLRDRPPSGLARLRRGSDHLPPQGGKGKVPPRARVKYSEHRLPADYLTAEQVRALDRPGTGAAAPVENAAGPLVKEPYWIE